MTKKSQIEYSPSEKLIAENIAYALGTLVRAWHEMRSSHWHESEDKNMRLAYIGVNAAINSQRLTLYAVEAIQCAPTCPEMKHLPAWNGYPPDQNEEI